MRPLEQNPQFTNKLIHSSSPYLRQHAHNPVFWYPWSREALDRSVAENKPILLSIGYSTCYWCHVMEREVFENLSIASLMNRLFINIKIDREEHPELDNIYMVARQMLTQEGGWPNNVFLTPELKPFFAGGAFGPEEAYGKPSFTRVLEWMNHQWIEHENELRANADELTRAASRYLIYTPPENPAETTVPVQAAELVALFKNHYDPRFGGFFQAPKFPQECALQFLLGVYVHTPDQQVLDMVTHSLEKMAAGGIYDHVGCGFHRYAVDKAWYVPHFEKMLYTQAMLARAYTDAARLTNHGWLADIARSILDFVSGPLTDGEGAFYSAIDAETDGVEGAYYAWTAQELTALLTPQEQEFFTRYYAVADIPTFPGHKHTEGQVIIAQKPLNEAAREQRMPYGAVAVMSGAIMNKLLAARNQREAPRLDNKIIVSWNGLMIDAFAHASTVFNEPRYGAIARRALDFLLEHAIDNDGKLKRIYAAGRAQFDATLEDYAFLIKGILSLHRAKPDDALRDAALSLASSVDELFAEARTPGYYSTQESDRVLLRGRQGDDATLPNANAVMADNFIELTTITGDAKYRAKAQAITAYFLNGKTPMLPESASMLQAALRLEEPGSHALPQMFDYNRTMEGPLAPDETVKVTADLFPADAQPGDTCELIITFDIADGWHINANRVNQPFLIPTQLDVHGDGVELLEIISPDPLRKPQGIGQEPLLAYEGLVHLTARLRLSPTAPKLLDIRAIVRFQPCRDDLCHAVRDIRVF